MNHSTQPNATQQQLYMREMTDLNLQTQVLLDKAENIANMKSPPMEQYIPAQYQKGPYPGDGASSAHASNYNSNQHLFQHLPLQTGNKENSNIKPSE